MTALSEIDVVVLCGGKGTRLQSVVSDRPKPMADIGGSPFLALLLDHVASFGFRRFVLCVGHQASIVESFFRTNEQPYAVEFSRESRPLGTAGALLNARALIRSANVLVLNGDSFCAVDYPGLVEFHETKRADVSLAVVRSEGSGEDYGSILLAPDGRVEAFEEKSGGNDILINAGVYLFRSTVLDTFPDRHPLSLENDVFPDLVGHNLFGYEVEAELYDIGTPARYARAQRHLEAQLRGT